MAPVVDEAAEDDENVVRVLCQMDNHLACVNSVRWSQNGKFLASAGDDKVIIVWTLGARYATTNGFGGNSEQYRAVSTLRSHSGDILDLSWSPNDNWLASCSVDNTVVIWNAQKWNETVAILKGHTGLVKGITWDPIGKYLASQSDDKTLRIWRTSDWTEEAVITEPFAECGGTTHVLRLCWSPDGQFLVSAHAMNNLGSVAQIIERQDWTSNRDFVGHRKAIACVRFNPNIMCLPPKNKSNKSHKLCCLGIGSRDRSLSIWLTSRKRPIVVLHDLFDNSVLDISWSQSGYQMMACSWDGTVAFIEFDEKEIGKVMDNDDKVLYKQKLYGKSLETNSPIQQLIENPELLAVREQKKQKENGFHSSNESSHKYTTNDSRNSTASTSKLLKGPTDKQIEIRLADGRRRITPLYIPPIEGLAFNAQPTTFSSSSETKTRIMIEKHDESNSSATSTPVKQSTTPQITKALPQLNTEPIKVNQTPDQSEVNAQKRKTSASDLPSGKRKPGRPPIANKEVVKGPESVKNSVTTETVTKITPKPLTAKDIMPTQVSNFCLPALRIDKSTTIKLSIKGDGEEPRQVSIDIENRINHSDLCALRLNENGDRIWQILISSKIIGVAANDQVVGCACNDNTLHVFTTSTGRRLHPPLVLNSAIARLSCQTYKIMAITCSAQLWLWDFSKHEVIIRGESLLSLLTERDVSIVSTGIVDNGSPLICVSTGKSFLFNHDFGTWTMVSNSHDLLNSCTDQKPHSFDPRSLPLSTLQSQTKSNKSLHTLFLSNANLQQSAVLSYIDQQLAASFVMGSANEYHFWLMALAQHLSQENMETRLREICQYLIGPLFKSAKSQWEPKILGNSKHDMLKEVLSIIASNLRLQRLYTEFKEQLEMILNPTNIS